MGDSRDAIFIHRQILLANFPGLFAVNTRLPESSKNEGKFRSPSLAVKQNARNGGTKTRQVR
jgi:hypothetical protein